MKIGTVKELKTHEYRVGLTPACVAEYTAHGHEVMVEAGAGVNAGYDDAAYRAAGATIECDPQPIYDACDMIVKVKEPLPEEVERFHEDQILYTFLHLAANRPLTDALMASHINAVAYETIEEDEQLPCLRPMSEIAGRLSILEGAKYLGRPSGGRGVLLGGIPGVPHGEIVIIGGGVVGMNACKMAVGCGANVTVLDLNTHRLEYLDDIFGARVTTLHSTAATIQQAIAQADIVVGAVLLPGRKAPHLLTRTDLATMQQGAVLVDVAVDQGGCFETTHPTTYDDPIYLVDGIVHYAVANMPGAVALTATTALTSATLPYGLHIADHGLEAACQQTPALRKGLNTFHGHCVCEAVASSLNLPYTAAAF